MHAPILPLTNGAADCLQHKHSSGKKNTHTDALTTVQTREAPNTVLVTHTATQSYPGYAKEQLRQCSEEAKQLFLKQNKTKQNEMKRKETKRNQSKRNQPTNQRTNQPTNQPTIHPSIHPTNQPTNEPTNQPTNERTNEPTNQPTNKCSPKRWFYLRLN